jgi:hypothetical protein
MIGRIPIRSALDFVKPEVANIVLPHFLRNPPKSYAEQPDDAVHAQRHCYSKGEHRISISLKARHRPITFFAPVRRHHAISPTRKFG